MPRILGKSSLREIGRVSLALLVLDHPSIYKALANSLAQ